MVARHRSNFNFPVIFAILKFITMPEQMKIQFFGIGKVLITVD
jgi:hypothetical protein